MGSDRTRSRTSVASGALALEVSSWEKCANLDNRDDDRRCEVDYIRGLGVKKRIYIHITLLMLWFWYHEMSANQTGLDEKFNPLGTSEKKRKIE